MDRAAHDRRNKPTRRSRRRPAPTHRRHERLASVRQRTRWRRAAAAGSAAVAAAVSAARRHLIQNPHEATRVSRDENRAAPKRNSVQALRLAHRPIIDSIRSRSVRGTEQDEVLARGAPCQRAHDRSCRRSRRHGFGNVSATLDRRSALADGSWMAWTAAGAFVWSMGKLRRDAARRPIWVVLAIVTLTPPRIPLGPIVAPIAATVITVLAASRQTCSPTRRNRRRSHRDGLLNRRSWSGYKSAGKSPFAVTSEVSARVR